MPQLDMFGQDGRTSVTWHYSIDPLRPERDPMATVFVQQGRNVTIEHGVIWPRLNVVHEEVAAWLAHTWDAYLFGEPGDVRTVSAKVHRYWLEQSGQRPDLLL